MGPVSKQAKSANTLSRLLPSNSFFSAGTLIQRESLIVSLRLTALNAPNSGEEVSNSPPTCLKAKRKEKNQHKISYIHKS